jgi:ABC-type amino acid transport substrate-binding protein
MANIRVDVNYVIKDGSEIVFRSPADCSAITGLVVYYGAEDGTSASKEFVLADAHGHNVGDIDHLFAENAVVKVILDVTHGMAFVQNADTNAYLEARFEKMLPRSELDEAINDALAQAKASGEFDGKDGEDGKTPVKGTDYFTEADKDGMVSAVISRLPIYNGEVVTV